MRAVIEGTVKFGYILESQDVFAARCLEYRDALPLIARRRRHSKAEEALRATGSYDTSGSQAYRDLLLTTDELSEIDAIYPREVRIKMEKRWSFGTLLDVVAKPTGAFGPSARTLLHGYSVASDLQHMSFEGVDMPLERDLRDRHRRTAIEVAHAAKLLADSFHLTWLRVNVALRFTGRSPDLLFAVRERHTPLLNELLQAQIDWESVEYGQDIQI